MVNGASRLSFTQLNTRVLGDLEVTGNLSVSGTGGGATLSAPVGSGLTIDGNDILLNHDNSIIAGFDEKVANNGTWNANGNFWDAYYTYPPGHTSFYSSETNATIEFSVQGQTAIMNNLRWHTGAYVDIHGREATTGQYMWLNRVDTYQGGGTEFTHGTDQKPRFVSSRWVHLPDTCDQSTAGVQPHPNNSPQGRAVDQYVEMAGPQSCATTSRVRPQRQRTWRPVIVERRASQNGTDCCVWPTGSKRALAD